LLVLVLTGPTAVGKSELALELAGLLEGEILAVDSMQVYRRMDIGTAKPTPTERSLVPHHLIDLYDPDQPFSAALYAELFQQAAAAVSGRGHLPIMVGGTGLYIRAAVRPFLFPEIGSQPEIRARLAALSATLGRAELHHRLAAVDPVAAVRIHPNDSRRVIRALEVFEATGRPISAWQQEHTQPSLFDPVFICLTRDRADLYRRIENRVDRMIADGFVGEVRSLLAAGYGRGLPAMQGLGYRELAAYLAGECSLPQATAEIKRLTRNYAKRQLTWFRHEPGLTWYDLSVLSSDTVRREILRTLAGRRPAPSNS